MFQGINESFMKGSMLPMKVARARREGNPIGTRAPRLERAMGHPTHLERVCQMNGCVSVVRRNGVLWIWQMQRCNLMPVCFSEYVDAISSENVARQEHSISSTSSSIMKGGLLLLSW